MTGNTELADVLYSLLYDMDFRDAFIAGGPQAQALDLTPEQRAALATVDPDELARTAGLIRSMVARGHIEDYGGLRVSFGKTLTELAVQGFDENMLCGRFVASPQFVPYREIPEGERGLTLEECFYEFLGDIGVSADTMFIATHELFNALIKYVRSAALATFDIRLGTFRGNGSAWYGFLAHRSDLCERFGVEPVVDGLVLYAVGAKGVVTGRSPDWLGDLLDLSIPEPDELRMLADRRGLAMTELEHAVRRMVDLGLLADRIS